MYSSTKKVLVFGLSMFILAGCTPQDVTDEKSKPKIVIPKWVTAPPQTSLDMAYEKAEVSFTTDLDGARLQAASNAKKQLSERLAEVLQTAYIQQLANEQQGEGQIETKLRQQVRAKLTRFDLGTPTIQKEFVNPETRVVTVLAGLDKAAIKARLEKRLAVLDAQLREYVHATSKGTHLAQLLSVVPALPTIEERKMLKSNLETLKEDTVSLPNDLLAGLMDKQVTKMIDLLILSLDATTNETAKFESTLKQAMKDQGLNMTARKPDLTFRYFLEAEDSLENAMHKVVIVVDIDMVNDQGKTFATLGSAFQGMDKDQQVALKQAMGALTNSVTDKIVASTVKYMNEVNRVNHNR